MSAHDTGHSGSGAGADAIITGLRTTEGVGVGGSSISLINLNMSDIRNTAGTSQSNGGIFYGGYWVIKNCKITGVRTSSGTGFISGMVRSILIEDSTCSISYGHFAYAYSSYGVITVKNSKVAAVLTYNGSQIRIEGTCIFTDRCGRANDTDGTDKLIIADGATVNIASSGASGHVIFSNTVTCEGTATVIYSGGSKKVTGTGTYIDKNGSTDLTVTN